VSIFDLQNSIGELSEDNTFLGTVLLHAAHSPSVKQYTKPGTKAGPAPPNRHETWADLTSKEGMTFASVHETAKEARYMLQEFVNLRKSVGDPAIIIEPKLHPTARCIDANGDLPIITTASPFRPLQNFDKTKINVPYTIPNKNVTRYFAIHNAQAYFANATFVESNCSNDAGICDRQGITNTTCTDFNSQRQASVVVQAEFILKKEGKTVLGPILFRSLKFTKLISELPRSMQVEDLQPHTQAMRRNLRDIFLPKVNNQGGFSCWGWVKKGMVQDAASKGDFKLDKNDTIPNQQATPHVCCLEPTNYPTQELKTLKFKIPRTSIHITTT